MDEDSVLLCRIIDESEAGLIGNFLDEAGVPYMFDSYHSIPYDSLFNFNKGYAGEIRVVKADLDRARTVLSEYRSWLGTDSDYAPPKLEP